MSHPYAKRSDEETQLATLSALSSALDGEKDKTERPSQKPASQSNSSASQLIQEKIQEEIFGRIAKNLKWLEILQEMTLNALKSGDKNKTETYEVSALLLGRIYSSVQCFSTAFVPILTSLYPHKYEVSQTFGKYVGVSYNLAKLTNTTAYVTEEFWQETLPDDAVEEFIDSEKRIIEILIPRKDEGPTDLSILIRHLYIATRNLCANVEQLRTSFKDDPYVMTFATSLRPRILQIEDASSILYKRLTKNSAMNSTDDTEKKLLAQNEKVNLRKETRDEKADRSINALIALKTGKAPDQNSSKKWVWKGSVKLEEEPRVLDSDGSRIV